MVTSDSEEVGEKFERKKVWIAEKVEHFSTRTFCQAQPQLNSTSTQTKAEVSLSSSWSSHPPTRPPTWDSSFWNYF